jgi:multimeric flavodoxin WrbA
MSLGLDRTFNVEVLVVYHSQSGNTMKMAEAVVRGIEKIDGAAANLKKAADADIDDLLKADGLILGSPVYFGYMSGMIKDFFDRTYNEVQGNKKVVKKPISIFISSGNDGQGALLQIQRICQGYSFKQVFEPVVALGEITEEILYQCQEMGQTLAAGLSANIY